MKILILMLMIAFSVPALAIDRYPFANPKQAERFNHLLLQFRCLVCQNEDLASSGAALADDLKGQIYKMVQEGKSDKSIIQYMTNRYGNFVLFEPPLQKNTLLLWLGPFALLLIGFALLYLFIKRQKNA